jgi:hypothetical protein
MIKLLGSNYYIDVDQLEKLSTIDNSKYSDQSGSTENEQQISVVRYDLFKNMIEILITEREELDDGIGIHGSKDLSIPFKIAYNTLLINNILKTI